MPIETITGSAVPGVNVYYVTPPNDIPNAFAAFMSAWLQHRTPWATDLYYRRLDAQDPTKQAKALAELEKIRAQSLAERGRNERAAISFSQERGRDATMRWIASIGFEGIMYRANTDKEIEEARLSLQSQLAGVMDEENAKLVAEEMALLRNSANIFRKSDQSDTAADVFQAQANTSYEKLGRLTEGTEGAVRQTVSADFIGVYQSEIQRSALSDSRKLEAMNSLRLTGEGAFGAIQGERAGKKYKIGGGGLSATTRSAVAEALAAPLGGREGFSIRTEGTRPPPPATAAPSPPVPGPATSPATREAGGEAPLQRPPPPTIGGVPVYVAPPEEPVPAAGPAGAALPYGGMSALQAAHEEQDRRVAALAAAQEEEAARPAAKAGPRAPVASALYARPPGQRDLRTTARATEAIRALPSEGRGDVELGLREAQARFLTPREGRRAIEAERARREEVEAELRRPGVVEEPVSVPERPIPELTPRERYLARRRFIAETDAPSQHRPFTMTAAEIAAAAEMVPEATADYLGVGAEELPEITGALSKEEKRRRRFLRKNPPDTEATP